MEGKGAEIGLVPWGDYMMNGARVLGTVKWKWAWKCKKPLLRSVLCSQERNGSQSWADAKREEGLGEVTACCVLRTVIARLRPSTL